MGARLFFALEGDVDVLGVVALGVVACGSASIEPRFKLALTSVRGDWMLTCYKPEVGEKDDCCEYHSDNDARLERQVHRWRGILNAEEAENKGARDCK